MEVLCTKKESAGILPYRNNSGIIEIMLVHPGGPFWAKKDEGAWSIAKGLAEEGEDLLCSAKREFEEETGMALRAGASEFFELGSIKQPGGKTVTAFAVQMDIDTSKIKSNTFEIEWPPKSGLLNSFPEIDRAGWFAVEEAQKKILKSQSEFLSRLLAKI